MAFSFSPSVRNISSATLDRHSEHTCTELGGLDALKRVERVCHGMLVYEFLPALEEAVKKIARLLVKPLCKFMCLCIGV